METSPSIIRILDVPPYNSFLLSCTIWAEVEGVKIPLPMTVDWIKRVETPDNVRFSPATPDEEAELRPDPVDGYHSVLRSSETNSEGDTVYRCRAVFVRDRGGAMGRQTSDSLVAVVGMCLFIQSHHFLAKFVKIAYFVQGPLLQCYPYLSKQLPATTRV